jgi:ATP-binding cassette subfamily B protein
VEVPTRITDAIRFEHVSFSYPGTDHSALRREHRAPQRRVIALVGENGAARALLVKLLADMYTPTSGRITVDGVDLARMAPDEWRTRLAGAFQDFYRFELSRRRASASATTRTSRNATRSSARSAGRRDDVIDDLEARRSTRNSGPPGRAAST